MFVDRAFGCRTAAVSLLFLGLSCTFLPVLAEDTPLPETTADTEVSASPESTAGSTASASSEATVEAAASASAEADVSIQLLDDEVTRNRLMLTLSEEPGTDGTYSYLTGQTAGLHVYIETPNSATVLEQTFRVVMKIDPDQVIEGADPWSLGVTEAETPLNEAVRTCTITENDDGSVTVIYEYKLTKAGTTVSDTLPVVFNNPISSNGTVKIYGEVLDADGNIIQTAEDQDETAIDSDSPLNLIWTTRRQEYADSKTPSESQATFEAVQDEEGNTTFEVTNLGSFTISTDRSSEGFSDNEGWDPVKTYSYTDTLQLPDQLTFTDRIKGTLHLSRDSSGKTIYIRDDDNNTLITLKTTEGDFSDFTIADNLVINTENNRLTLKWSRANGTDASSVVADFAPAEYTVTFSSSYPIVQWNPDSGTTPTSGVTITNTAALTTDYFYTDSLSTSSESTITVTAPEGYLDFDKRLTSGGSYYRSPFYYELTAGNPGTTDFSSLGYLEDTLPESLTMTASDIEQTLGQTHLDSEKIIIWITNAGISNGIYDPETGTLVKTRTVYGYDGAYDVTLDSSTSGGKDYTGNSYDGAASESDVADDTLTFTGRIRITKNTGGTYHVLVQNYQSGTITEISEADYATVTDALQQIGYFTTSDTEYEISWYFCDTTEDETTRQISPVQNEDDSYQNGLVLNPGDEVTRLIYSTGKSRLERSDDDNGYGSSWRWTYNTAYAYTDGGSKSDYANSDRYGDLSIAKSCEPTGKASEGDLLTYQIDYDHRNSVGYDVMPITDHMSGMQQIAVPVEGNEGKEWTAWSSVRTVEIDGVSYYVLGPSTSAYRQVVTGAYCYNGVSHSSGLVADSITVTEIADNGGWDTLIKWYFTDFDDYHNDEYIRYNAYVCLPSDVLTGTIDNVAYMNDHESHRLVAEMPGREVSSVNFEKKIVLSEGTTPEDDELDDDDLTLIRKEPGGYVVEYRINLTRTSGTSLSGSLLCDALPLCISRDYWNTTNVEVSYKTSGDNVTVVNGDSWTINHTGHDGTEESSTSFQQYLHWNDDFSIQYAANEDDSITSGTCWIYVKLTFPDGDSSSWDEFSETYGGGYLENTFWLDTISDTVQHIVGASQALIFQKSVVETGMLDTSTGSYYINEGNGRTLYTGKDSETMERTVTYAVAIYNGGVQRLYLNDVIDILPEGLTFYSLGHSTTTGLRYYGGQQALGPGDSGTSFLFQEVPVGNVFTVTDTAVSDTGGSYPPMEASTETLTDGRQKVTFHFDYSEASLYVINSAYDEELDKDYLNQGEMVTFTFTCLVGTDAETDEILTNTAAMQYYNYTNAEPKESETATVEVLSTSSNYSTGIFSSSDQSVTFTENNDGTFKVLSGTQAVEAGYAEEGDESYWLTSTVSLQRSEIEPGLTKEIVSTISGSQAEESYGVSALPTDILGWKISASNDGERAIQDFTITDTMDSPYTFCRDVELTVTQTPLDEEVQVYPPSGRLTLFTFLDVSSTAVTLQPADSEDSLTAAIGSSDWTDLNEDGTWQVRFSYDSRNQMVMELHISDPDILIPSQGAVNLYVYTNNTSATRTDGLYRNTAKLHLTSSTFTADQVTAGQVEEESDGTLSILSSATANASSGYATIGDQMISENGIENVNQAYETDAINWILLSPSNSSGSPLNSFTYTLTVENTSDLPIDRFVLIDNLAQTGDSDTLAAENPRGSAYAILFASDPQITASIVSSDGTVTVLDESLYTIDYSTRNSFEPYTADITGRTDVGWTENPTDVQSQRSFRFTSEEDSDFVIPAHGKIQITFQAVVADAVQSDPYAYAGLTAWNSFGYSYRVLSDYETVELESASLETGVRIAPANYLSKQLLDENGEVLTAPLDLSFDFVLYEGSADLLDSLDLSDAEAVLTALADYNPVLISVPIAAGESSGTIRLEDADAAMQADTEYTLVEITRSDWAGSPVYQTFSTTGQEEISFAFVNQFSPQNRMAVAVQKEWDDALYAGNRPASITVHLTAELQTSDGTAVSLPAENSTQVLSEDNDWYYLWEDLPASVDSQTITYSIEEDTPDGYTCSDTTVWNEAHDTETITLTNTYTDLIDIEVEKRWAGDQESERPASVQVQLYADDEPLGDPVELNSSNLWFCRFEDLPRKVDGRTVSYAVREINVPDGYTAQIRLTTAWHFVITNTRNSSGPPGPLYPVPDTGAEP